MKEMLVGENKTLLWTDVADPVMKENEVLLEIHAVALNRADILQKNGSYPSPKGWPEWMGLELAGVIIDMGEGAKANSSYQIGDRVCALVGGGGYAEKIAVPYELLMPIPTPLSFEEASAIPEAYATSYLNLFVEGHLQAGQTFYMAAGASGLASAAIPMAKAMGATVVTSVVSDEKADEIKHLGADYIVNTTKQSLADAFKELEAMGKPVAVAMDCLSGDMLGEAMPYMARGGYWVVISTLAGTETKIMLRPLLTKGLHLVGSMLRNRTNAEKAFVLKSIVEQIFPFLEDGTIKPTIYKVLPMEEAEEAHAILERFENTGKVVLKVK